MSVASDTTPVMEIEDFRAELAKTYVSIRERNVQIGLAIKAMHELAGNEELGRFAGNQVASGLVKAVNAIAVADYELKRAVALAKAAADSAADAERRRASARRRLGI